jgi:hypothetical protein
MVDVSFHGQLPLALRIDVGLTCSLPQQDYDADVRKVDLSRTIYPRSIILNLDEMLHMN